MATNQTHLATQEPAPERRRNPRVAPTLLTYVSFGGSNGGMVLDVSETGMALATALPMPEAQTLNIAIPCDQPHQLIEVRGTIVWISDSKRRVGVRLLDPSPASREFLRKWVGAVLERKLSGAPEPVENNFSYFSPASIVENCAPLPLRSERNDSESDDIDPLLDSFVAALRQKPQSRKSLLIMNAANAATNGRVPVGETEKISAFPVNSEPNADATPADLVSSDEVLTTGDSEVPPVYDSPVVSDPLPAPSPQFSEQQVPQTFTEQPWLPTDQDVPVEEGVRIAFDAQPQAVSSVASQMAPDALPEREQSVAADVGMIDQHADLEPPAREIAEHPVARPEPKPRTRTTRQAMASKNISFFRAPLLLAASAIIVASFAIGIGIGRSFWKRHASVTPNTARATVAQQTPLTPPPVTPTPKTSSPSTLTATQTSSGAVGANGATSSATSHPSGSGSPAPTAAPPGKKDGASPTVTAAASGEMLVTPGEGDTPMRVDLPEEAVLISAPLEIRSQRFAYVPGTGTNHHGKVRKERLIIGELDSPKTPQISTPPAGTSAAQTGERIVTVRATIDGDGHVTYVDPLSGPIILIPNVMTAVREWRYKPSSLDGQPVQTEADLTIKFRTTR
jgi:PilZ domain-containing protein/TonB-like protein